MSIADTLNKALDVITGNPAVDPLKERLENGWVVGRQMDYRRDVPPDTPLTESNRTFYRSDSGPTREIMTMIGRDLLPAKDRAEVERLRSAYMTVLDRFQRNSRRNPEREYHDYLADRGDRLACGAPVELARGISDFKDELATELAADRKALNQLYCQVESVLRPHCPKAVNRAEQLFDTELVAERARWKRFGVELKEPTELLKSLWEAVKACRAIAKAEPPTAASGAPLPKYWGWGLFDLEA